MKQTIIALLFIAYIATTTAQTNNILRGLVTIKGEDKKPLRGVAVQAVGLSNKVFTDDNGFYELACKGMSAGDVVSLIVSKDNYVVLDKNALQEVTIKKDPTRRFDIVMQEEGKRKTDIDRAEKNIKDNINRKVDEQTQALDVRLANIESKMQQSAVNDIERRAYQDSIQKLNTQRSVLENDRDRALQLARETAEKLTAFDTEGASKEIKQAQILFEVGKLDSAYVAINELTIQNKVKAANRLQQKSDSLRKSAIKDYFYKAKLAIANGKFDEAERLYTEGVRLDETNMDNLGTLAYFLSKQNKKEKAITYYEKALALAKTEDLIGTFCMNLGVAYKNLNKMSEAEKYYLKSLDITERLAKSNPQQFEADLANTANSLGIFYSDLNKMPEAEKYYLKSLDIYERLAKSNPQQFEADLARTAMNLGVFYQTFNKMPDAEKYYLKSLDIYERLAKSDPQQFEANWAATAMNLGVFYSNLNKMLEAEKYYLKSLDIYERLAKSNPQQFEADLARTLNNFGVFYKMTKQLDKAQNAYSRALSLRQKALLNGLMHYESEYNRVFSNMKDLRDTFEVQKNYAKVVEIQTERAKSAEILRGVFAKGDSIASAEYGSLAWFALFATQYAAAETAARRGLTLDKTQTWIKTNLCHALLFQNKDKEAKAEYDALKIQTDANGKSYRDILKEDFDVLEQAGLEKKQLDKVRKWVAE